MNTIEQRDHDLAVIWTANQLMLKGSDLCFVITGSYSIEALTGKRTEHGDIDANVFTGSIPAAMNAIPDLLGQKQITDMDFIPYKQTADRIEYDVSCGKPGYERRLEIHVIDGMVTTENRVYVKCPDGRRKSEIDIVNAELKNSKGNMHGFLVKSLAYSVATWAIRLSGTAENQLRPVSSRDIYNFMLLLEQKIILADVYAIMKNHPQMPDGATAENVYFAALSKIG